MTGSVDWYYFTNFKLEFESTMYKVHEKIEFLLYVQYYQTAKHYIFVYTPLS
jgi:hypothetical protein